MFSEIGQQPTPTRLTNVETPLRPTPSRLRDRVPAYRDEYVDSYLRRISRTAHLPLIDVVAMLDYPHLHFRPTKEASAEFWEALSHLGHEPVDTLKQRLYEPSHRKRLHRKPGSFGKCVRCDTNRDEAVIALTRRHHICPKHHTWNSAYRSAHDMHQANPEEGMVAMR